MAAGVNWYTFYNNEGLKVKVLDRIAWTKAWLSCRHTARNFAGKRKVPYHELDTRSEDASAEDIPIGLPVRHGY